MSQTTIKFKAEGEFANLLIEGVIAPALQEFACKVDWPEFPEPEFSVTYDTRELWQALMRKSNAAEPR